MKSFIYLLLVFIFFTSHANAQKERLCVDENTNLSCLKKNFDTLYSTNYKLFWEILRDSAQKAQACSSTSDTLEFITLSTYIRGNSEVEEYFSEVTENIFMTNTDCYMKTIVELNENSKIEHIHRLQSPLFTDENEIKRVFLKFRDLGKFTEIIELYFNDK